MKNILGWTKSKKLNDKLAVLAETQDGKTVVILGDYIEIEEPEDVLDTPEEHVLNTGNPLPLSEALGTFPDLDKANYYSE